MPNTLEVLLFFHVFSFAESLVYQKSVIALRNAAFQNGTTIGIVNQMTVRAICALCCVAQLAPLLKVFAPFIIFDRQFVRFIIFYLRVNGSDYIMDSKCPDYGTGPLCSAIDGIDTIVIFT